MPDLMRMGSNPDYLASWDLDGLPNREAVLTIDRIVDEVVSSSGSEENCTVMYFSEGKPMILNLTNKKILCNLFQTRDPEEMKGKSIIVGGEPVRAFGGIIDALRIRPQLLEEPGQELRCEDCGEALRPVGRMTRMQLAAYTRRKYGRCLCAACAAKAVRSTVCD